MHLLLTFDLHTDLLDVPARVAADKEAVRQQFLRWVYQPSNSERYRGRKSRAATVPIWSASVMAVRNLSGG